MKLDTAYAKQPVETHIKDFLEIKGKSGLQKALWWLDDVIPTIAQRYKILEQIKY